MRPVEKELRFHRIFRDDGRSLIVAIDHSIFGQAFPELERTDEVLRKIITGGADAVIATLGTIRHFGATLGKNLGVIWSTTYDPRCVETAVKLGVDGIKTTYFGTVPDERVFEQINALGLECDRWGMLLLAEIVPAKRVGGRVEVIPQTELVKIATRAGAEQGADIVKTAYTGTPESFRNVIENIPIPVVILGGAKMDTDVELLNAVKDSVGAGGSGVAFGRNIWQHKDPISITRAISAIIHKGTKTEEALDMLH